MNNPDAFEEWARGEGYSTTRLSDGTYHDPKLDSLLHGWEGATDRAIKLCNERADALIATGGAYEAESAMILRRIVEELTR